MNKARRKKKRPCGHDGSNGAGHHKMAEKVAAQAGEELPQDEDDSIHEKVLPALREEASGKSGESVETGERLGIGKRLKSIRRSKSGLDRSRSTSGITRQSSSRLRRSTTSRRGNLFKMEVKRLSQQSQPAQYDLGNRYQPRNAVERVVVRFCGHSFLNAMHIKCCCCNGTDLLTRYLSWSFRTSFLMLFCSSLFLFMVLTVAFAVLMMLFCEITTSECIQPNINDNARVYMNEMLMLSWTTLSTVGYGNIYPSLGSELSSTGNVEMCGVLSFLCSVESFVGVLYAGFVGAILFGKVLRMQSRAQVQYSDPIVIRYGSGVANEFQLIEDGIIPCPVLEFRCINKLYDQIGGEIMEATMNCIAILDAPSDKIKVQKCSVQPSSLIASVKKESEINDKARFAKLYIGNQQNPFFKHSWLVQHTLDAESPLLSKRVRKMIQMNNGGWPSQYNNAAGVRECLHFKQISVTFSGVCNSSAISVYESKLYDIKDVNVGYQFVRVLFRDENDDFAVDIEMINDVIEQEGGGGDLSLSFLNE